MTAIVTSVTALLFVGAGASKLTGQASSLEMRDHLAIAPMQWTGIGAVEVVGAAGAAAGLAFTPLGIAATGGLALLSAGAIAAHVRNGDTPAAAAPAAVALVLSVGSLVLQALDISAA
jgi:hypothetical protein